MPFSDHLRDEPLDSHLLEELNNNAATSPVIKTLANGEPNWITAVTMDGVRIETNKSRAEGSGAQLVPAWMLNVAWWYLKANGELSNSHLLDTNGLNVKRSSAVCALLATLPDVDVVSTRPIVLRLR